jgi:hypothetical protein
LVLSLALAVWWGEHGLGGPIEPVSDTIAALLDEWLVG